MKNHLNLRPFLRFVATSADAGGEISDAQDAPVADGAAEKARLYDEAQEQGKTELQKALDKAEQAEARVKALEVQAVRAQVAAAKGVDVDLLSGSTLEELEASADRLLEWRGAQIPKGAPSSDAGHRGDEIRSSKQLTREDLKTMSAEQINQARRAGQLNDVMGLA